MIVDSLLHRSYINTIYILIEHIKKSCFFYHDSDSLVFSPKINQPSKEYAIKINKLINNQALQFNKMYARFFKKLNQQKTNSIYNQTSEM